MSSISTLIEASSSAAVLLGSLFGRGNLYKRRSICGRLQNGGRGGDAQHQARYRYRQGSRLMPRGPKGGVRHVPELQECD